MAQAKPQKGWSHEEIGLLADAAQQAAAQKQPLRTAFEAVAAATHRQPNSVRNFYYAACRQGLLQPAEQRRAPARPFTPEETDRVMQQIAAARRQGVSVRRCTLQLAGGDRTAALRLQNKYRALLRTSPGLAEQPGPNSAQPASRPARIQAAVQRLAQIAPGLREVDAEALLTNLAALFAAAAKKRP